MFLTNNQLLLIKREATYATDPIPTVSANALEALNIKIDYQGDVLARNMVRPTLSNVQPVMGQRWIDISFTAEIKGGGTKGTASRIGDALVACSLAETASAGSSVIYTPADASFKSATIYFYEMQDTGNCRLHKITGARGTVNFNFEAGKIATADFKFSGLYNDPTEAANPSAPTYETTLPPIVESSTLTLNSVALIAQAVKLDMGNTLVKRDDLNSVAGLLGFLITDRAPVGTINPEAVLSATYDFYADFKAATARALSLVLGSASGNKVTVTAPKLVLEKLAEADRNGIHTQDISFAMAMNTGGDEFQLKFE